MSSVFFFAFNNWHMGCLGRQFGFRNFAYGKIELPWRKNFTVIVIFSADDYNLLECPISLTSKFFSFPFSIGFDKHIHYNLICNYLAVRNMMFLIL